VYVRAVDGVTEAHYKEVPWDKVKYQYTEQLEFEGVKT